MDWPKCLKCSKGLLIPLSDYGQEGASVMFKAWVCTNPECGFSLRVDKGDVTYGKKKKQKKTNLLPPPPPPPQLQGSAAARPSFFLPALRARRPSAPQGGDRPAGSRTYASQRPAVR